MTITDRIREIRGLLLAVEEHLKAIAQEKWD